MHPERSEVVERLGTDRFLVRRRLGRGPRVETYEAWDRDRDVAVALKVLREDDDDTVALWKDLVRSSIEMSHPGLVGYVELLGFDDVWCAVQELLPGPDFVEAMKAVVADRSRFAEGFQRLRRTIGQVARALGHLHAAGWVHGDVRPSNALLDASARVRLVDYGLTPLLHDRGLEWTPAPAYAAPELRRCCDPAVVERPRPPSDLYSLGVMIYESLTGIHPGAGRDRRPSERRARLPDDLDELCAQLLLPEPSSRPTADEVAARVDVSDGGVAVRIADVPGSKRLAPWSSADGQRDPRAPLFVGRFHELERLHLALSRVRGGEGQLVWLRGQPGLGKTALGGRFLDEVRSRDTEALVLHARSHRHESVPFKSFDEIILQLVEVVAALDAGERAALPSLSEAARSFPVLDRIAESRTSPAAARPDLADPEGTRRRAFQQLRGLLRRLGEKRSLVLFLDDLQWGDADSAALFVDLIRPPMPPYLVLASFRTEDFGLSPFLDGLPETALAQGEEIELAELNAEESMRLAERLISRSGLGAARGADGLPSIPAEVLRQVVAESQGNPFFLGTLSRAVVREAELVANGQLSSLPEKLTLGGWMAERVRELPPVDRRLVELVAIADRPLHRDLARRALSLALGEDSGAVDVGRFEAALVRLANEGLVRLAGRGGEATVELGHDRLHEPILGLMNESLRRQRHRELALVLESSVSGADSGALAEHFRRTEDDERAARYALEAADQALEQFAFERGARLIKLALDLEKDGERAAELRTRLADTLRLAGRGVEAAGEYLAAVRQGAEGRVVELQRRAAEQLLISGHTERGLRVLRHVCRKVGLQLPETPAQRGATWLRRLWLRIRGIGFRKRREDEVPQERLLRVDTLWSATVGYQGIDPAVAAALQATHLQLALRVGEPKRVARALAMEVATLAKGGTKTAEKTEQLLRAAVELAREIGDPESLGRAALVTVMAASGQGRWAEAVRVGRQAEAIFTERCSGVTWERRTNQELILAALNGLGRFREIAEQVPALLAQARETGDRYAENSLGIWLARIALIQDRPERALADLASIRQRWPAEDDRFPRLNAQLVECEVGIYRRDPGTWTRLSELWQVVVDSRLLESQLARVRLNVLRARAALVRLDHVSEAEASTLRASVERQVELVRTEGTEWGNDLAAVVLASLLSRQGRSQEAVELWTGVEDRSRERQIEVLAEVCRYRRGEATPGEEGEVLCSKALERLSALGVAAPERVCDLFAPR